MLSHSRKLTFRTAGLFACVLALHTAFADRASGQLVEDLFGGTSVTVSKPEIEATLTPRVAKAGDEVRLSIRVLLPAGSYTYSQDPSFSQNTKITVSEAPGLEPIDDAFSADREASRGFEPLFKANVEKYEGEVTFTRRYRLNAGVDPSSVYVRGQMKHLVCDKASCRPYPHSFAVSLTGGPVPPPGSAPPPSTAGTPSRGSQAPVGGGVGNPTTTANPEIKPFDLLSEGAQPAGLGMNLLFAFLGGLILNVMPCVLPVLAIKVLSFVQQSGESRRRVFALNGTYALGVTSVFLLLASLAVFLGYGWGQLFQLDEFNLVMAAIVFAMGLSLLGVFEIPVPGMIGSAAGGQHREGLLGAFMTGIFATLLATPCSGPFMGTTLAWSVKQPAHVVYLVWGTMGLGMASPYLVIGAFPSLVNWLPKPGMWMVRFKEFAGFVLMGAVIWLLNSVSPHTVIPALVMFVGIALGVWMVGNLYDHGTPRGRKMAVRLVALVMAGGVITYGFRMQYQGDRLPWQPFSTAKVEELRSAGTPTLIDFTANWCAICKTNEELALNRRATIKFVEQHGIVPLYADYTDEDPEIRRWLELCRQDGVPLTLIFPKGRPNEAITLRGLYSQGTLLGKLREAVEKGGGGPAAAAETAARESSRTSAALVH